MGLALLSLRSMDVLDAAIMVLIVVIGVPLYLWVDSLTRKLLVEKYGSRLRCRTRTGGTECP